MDTQLGTTNLWLAILAIAVVVQTIMMIVAAVVTLRMARRAGEVLEKVDRSIYPLTTGLSMAIEDLHGLTETARRAGESVKATAESVGGGVRQARNLLIAELWPALGAIRAAKAAVSAFSRRRVPRLSSRDRIAEANFISEGAPVHGTR